VCCRLGSAEIESAREFLQSRRRQEHPNCFLCSNPESTDLGLQFEIDDKGRVRADFECKEHYQSYDGILHGGIISLLLDCAMTNCLFANDIRAVTAELNVRYIRPVEIGFEARITAGISKSKRPLYFLEAEIIQNGKLKVRAKGKFMDFP